MDSAFAGGRSEGIIRARGGTPRIAQTSTWGGVEACNRPEAHNSGAVRALPDREGARRRQTRLRPAADARLGLAKAGLQPRLEAIAYDLRRGWRLLAPTPA